jgi:hypothetical protein
VLALSDIQTGYVRRHLVEFLALVPGPGPSNDAEAFRQWCKRVCGVETLDEVSKRWTKLFKDLGRSLFGVGLADRVRKDRPSTPRNLLLQDLTTAPDMAHAILCLAVDEVEGNKTLQRARREPVPDPEKERAAELTVRARQITAVLANLLIVDGDTFEKFRTAVKSLVENWLHDPADTQSVGTEPRGARCSQKALEVLQPLDGDVGTRPAAVQIPQNPHEFVGWLRQRVKWLRDWHLSHKQPKPLAPGFQDAIVQMFGSNSGFPHDPADVSRWASQLVWRFSENTLHQSHDWLETNGFFGAPSWRSSDPANNSRIAIEALEHLSALLNFVGQRVQEPRESSPEVVRMGKIARLLPEELPQWDQLKDAFSCLMACLKARPEGPLDNAEAYHQELSERLREVGSALREVRLQDCIKDWDYPPAEGSYARYLLQLNSDPTPEAIRTLLAQDAKDPVFFDGMRKHIGRFAESLLADSKPLAATFLNPPATARLEDAGLIRSAKSKRRVPKRGSRSCNIEKLQNELIEHLRGAQDHARASIQNGGMPTLLPRPNQKELGRRTRLSESNVSRCLSDPCARELRILWDLANDLEGIIKWTGKKRHRKEG